MARKSGWGVAAALVAAISCNGGGSGSISLEDLPARVLDVVCQGGDCGTYPDEASCRAAQLSTLGQLQADVAAGRTKYDGAQAAACLDVIAAAAGGCRIAAYQIDEPDACTRTFTGTVAEGGACVIDEECVSAHCDRPPCANGCCAGTCGAAPTQVPIGGDCGASGSCVAGAACDFGAAKPQCIARRATGKPCAFSDECVSGNVCVGASGVGDTGVCGPPPDEGQACIGTGACARIADFCDPTAHKCQPRLAVGSPCVSVNGDSGCVRYALCDSTSGKCVARGRIGDPCDPIASSTCLSNLDCGTSNTCVVQPAPPVCPPP